MNALSKILSLAILFSPGICASATSDKPAQILEQASIALSIRPQLIYPGDTFTISLETQLPHYYPLSPQNPQLPHCQLLHSQSTPIRLGPQGFSQSWQWRMQAVAPGEVQLKDWHIRLLSQPDSPSRPLPPIQFTIARYTNSDSLNTQALPIPDITPANSHPTHIPGLPYLLGASTLLLIGLLIHNARQHGETSPPRRLAPLEQLWHTLEQNPDPSQDIAQLIHTHRSDFSASLIQQLEEALYHRPSPNWPQLAQKLAKETNS